MRAARVRRVARGSEDRRVAPEDGAGPGAGPARWAVFAARGHARTRSRTLPERDVHSAHLPDTPAGPVTVWVSPTGVRRIEFGPLPEEDHTAPPGARPDGLSRAVGQIEEYFSGDRTTFDLPLDLDGTTAFQRAVYARLVEVPFGRLTTYGELATEVGRPQMARAVGQAVGANPVPILVPCHRVVSGDGRLGGFSGGLPAKVALLGVERVAVDGASESSRVHPEVIPLDL